VFENRVLRRIFGLTREETAGSWRRQQSKELHNLYASPNIVKAIESRRMSWTRHVEVMGEVESTKVWSENLKERNHPEDLGVSRMIILKWI
jgi:hypothetical protein